MTKSNSPTNADYVCERVFYLRQKFSSSLVSNPLSRSDVLDFFRIIEILQTDVDELKAKDLAHQEEVKGQAYHIKVMQDENNRNLGVIKDLRQERDAFQTQAGARKKECFELRQEVEKMREALKYLKANHIHIQGACNKCCEIINEVLAASPEQEGKHEL